jgi:hypothetical protein
MIAKASPAHDGGSVISGVEQAPRRAAYRSRPEIEHEIVFDDLIKDRSFPVNRREVADVTVAPESGPTTVGF